MVSFNEMLRSNVYEYGLNQDEIDRRLKEKKELRTMLKRCTYADRYAKEYVKKHIADILLKKYKINKENINKYIAFSDVKKMSAQDIFESILYLYKRDFGVDGLDRLIKDFNFDMEKYNEQGDIYFEISEEDIRSIPDKIDLRMLGFVDKVNILAQRIYQLYKGNGTIDEIRDMNIDGVSAGVSGIPFGMDYQGVYSYDSIWIFYHGKSIHMSFLGFHSEKELIRVCKNVYKYNNPGQLSQARGYIVNEMIDGSRVSVARPPFCESWVLFIRKFDSVKKQDMGSLITDENAALPIQLIWWIIKGCCVTGITGQQGTGKTTLLMSMIGFINPSYNLRIQELSFELHLRKIYPKRNIVTFRETGNVSGQEGLDFAKKTDGTVNILGEVATAPVASWLVQMAGVGSLFTLFTHHAKTTKDLVISMRNALLQEGGFSNERIATEQVCCAINFDIHMIKDNRGHRYIERITQIIPMEEDEKQGLTYKMFKTKDIIRYDDGKYVICGGLTDEIIGQISGHLTKQEQSDFMKFVADLSRVDGR
jgi:pilus assembly protein CpaF